MPELCGQSSAPASSRSIESKPDARKDRDRCRRPNPGELAAIELDHGRRHGEGAAARGSEPSTVIKMAMGCAGCGAAYLIMAGAAFYAGADKASWLWLFAFFVVITTAELYISPIGLSLVSKVAPARHLALMMGVWLATSFIGNFGAGYLGSFWSGMSKPSFFLMIAAIAIAAGAVIWAFDRPLRRALKHGV